MPEYNLGRAHGEIVIDTKTKGIEKGDAALSRFEKTVVSLQAVITRFDAVLDRLEAELDQVASAANKADRALDGLHDKHATVTKSTVENTRVSREYGRSLDDNIRSIQKLIAIGKPFYKTYAHISDSMKAWNNANGIAQHTAAVNKATMFTRGLSVATAALGSKIIGANRAYAAFSDRQNSIMRTAGKIAAVSAGFSAFNRLGPVVARLGAVNAAAGLLGTYLPKLGQRVYDVNRHFRGIYRSANGVSSSLDSIGGGVVRAMLGFKLAQHGVESFKNSLGFLGKGKGALLAGAAVLAQGTGLIGIVAEAGAKSLKMLSNAIKTLGGGLYAIPGIFGTIIGAAVPVISSFKRLGTLFGDILKNSDDPKKLAKALQDLPEEFRPLAQKLIDAKNALKDIGDAGLKSFLGPDPAKEIDALVASLSGPLTKNFQVVNNAARGFRQQLIATLADGKNISQLNTVFNNSSIFIGNMKKAIDPLLTGLLRLTAVGSNFFTDFTGGAGKAATKFNDFIQKAAESGKLRAYMDNALAGIKDLVKGTVDLTKGLWKVLTAFSTNNGENALDRYAKSMKKFNDALSGGADPNSNLGKFANGLNKFALTTRGLGHEKWDQFKEVFRAVKEPIGDVLKAIQSFGKDFSTSFVQVLVVGIQAVAVVVKNLYGIMSVFGSAAGWILGLAVSWKILFAAIKPATSILKALVGLKIALAGLQSVAFSGLTSSFTQFLGTVIPGVNRITAVFDKMRGAFGKIGVAIAGAGAAALIGLGVYSGISSAQNKIDDFNKTLEEGKKSLADYKESLRGAFAADNGATGKNVLDAVSNQITTQKAQLEKVAGEDISWTKNIKALWFGGGKNGDAFGSGMGPFSFAQGNDFNNLQKTVQDARHAKEQLDQLGISSQDLASIITGTDTAFGKFKDTLNTSGKSDAANWAQQQRDAFVGIQHDFETMSPGAVNLANAIKAMGDAGQDSASKLSALNAALKALGLDKTDEIDAALAFSDAIRKLGDEAAQLVDKSAGLDKIFGPDGSLNTKDGGANVNNLVNALKEGVRTFKDAAVSSGDVEGAYKRLMDTIPQLAQQFTAEGGNVEQTAANIKNLLTTKLGADDRTIQLLLAVTGEDKVKADIAALILNANNPNPDGEIKVPLHVDRGTMQDDLDKILGKGVAAVGDQSITISKVNMTPQVLAALQAAIPGLQLPGAPPPKPAEIAVAPQPVAPTAPAGQQPQVGGIPVSPQVASAVPAVDQEALSKANAEIDALKGKIAELNANPPKLQVDPAQFEALKQSTQQAVQAFEDMKTQIQAKLGEATAIVSGWGQSLMGLMGALAGGMMGMGVSIGSQFAAGLNASAPLVAAAAANLARQVTDHTKPGSPTKKGPLSGSGWVGYSGTKTGMAYATSLAATSGAVSGAASKVAGGVAGAFGSVGGSGDIGNLGRILGLFNDVFGIGSKLVDTFSQVADTIFKTMKLISDPLGKGTFFGQTPGSAFGYKRDPKVSDADLAQKRAQKLQHELSKDSKAETPEDKKKAEQDKKDKEKQDQITNDLIDKVIAGDRVAPVPDEQKQAVSDEEKKLKGTAPKGGKKGGKKAAPKIESERGNEVNQALALQQQQSTGDGTNTAKKGKQPKAIVPLTDAQAELNAQRIASTLGQKLDEMSPEDRARVQSGEVSVKTNDQILAELVKQTPLLQDAINISKDENSSQSQATSALDTVNQLLNAQGEATTPAAKQQKQALEGLASTISGNAGLTTNENPIDQAAGIAGNAANVAKDVFASIQSVMDSIGAANELGDMMVRGLSSTEDVYKAVDKVQTFITTAAQIASAVSSGLGVAAGIAGAAGSDPSGGGAAAAGALSGASQIASLVSAGLSTVNGIIDLGQEVYRIAGKYLGQFAGFLAGGSGAALMGQVKYLLDTTDGSLKAWSADNPEDKRVFDNPFQPGGIKSEVPKIGQISVFGGPAQDPREMTNEMMFAVSAAGSGIWSNDL